MSAKVIEFGFLNSQIKVSLFLGLILILACVLRFYHFDFQSLWYDEVHITNGVDPDLLFREIVEYSRTDQPPLFFLVLQCCFKIFGFNDLVARSVVTVIGVTGVVAMFFLGNDIKDVNSGLISVLPSIIILVSLAIVSFKKYIPSVLLIVIFSFSILTLFVGTDYYSTIKKEQLREVAKEVIEANEQPSVIFSYYAWHYNYYFKSLGSTKTVIHPESVKYETELSKVDHVWLIQCHEDNIGATNEQLNLI